jgi:hypothetical protein
LPSARDLALGKAGEYYTGRLPLLLFSHSVSHRSTAPRPAATRPRRRPARRRRAPSPRAAAHARRAISATPALDPINLAPSSPLRPSLTTAAASAKVYDLIWLYEITCDRFDYYYVI